MHHSFSFCLTLLFKSCSKITKYIQDTLVPKDIFQSLEPITFFDWISWWCFFLIMTSNAFPTTKCKIYDTLIDLKAFGEEASVFSPWCIGHIMAQKKKLFGTHCCLQWQKGRNGMLYRMCKVWQCNDELGGPWGCKAVLCGSFVISFYFCQTKLRFSVFIFSVLLFSFML